MEFSISSALWVLEVLIVYIGTISIKSIAQRHGEWWSKETGYVVSEVPQGSV